MSVERGMTAIEAMEEYLDCKQRCIISGLCPPALVRICYFGNMAEERVRLYQCTRTDCEAYHYCSTDEGRAEGICENAFAFLTFKAA